MLIDVRCQHCKRLLCQVSKDFFGIVRLYCRRCGKSNTVSLATILKQLEDKPAIIRPPAQVRTRA